MCYTGLCPYEISSGPDAGDCTLPHSTENFPDDAGCVIAERGQEIAGLEEALGEIDPPPDREAYEAAKALVKSWRENPC